MPDLSKLPHSLTSTTEGDASDEPRVLVADDDPLSSRALKSLSENERLMVTVVRDGREAYRMLNSDTNFKAAVFNITLANLACLELLHFMKSEKRLSRIPVVVIGDAHNLEGVGQSFAAGAIAFLYKPFGAEQLLRAVHLALHQQQPKKFHHSA